MVITAESKISVAPMPATEKVSFEPACQVPAWKLADSMKVVRKKIGMVCARSGNASPIPYAAGRKLKYGKIKPVRNHPIICDGKGFLGEWYCVPAAKKISTAPVNPPIFSGARNKAFKNDRYPYIEMLTISNIPDGW